MGIIFVYSIYMRKLLTVLSLVIGFLSYGQNARSFQNDYANAKDLLQAGMYEEAMGKFEVLTIEHPENPFYIYAHYYYGIAAMKAGKLLDANFKLAQIEEKFPEWEQLEEVYYIRSIVAFENEEYRKGLGLINKIEDRSILKDVEKEKLFYLSKVNELSLLIDLQTEYPEDEVIAEVLAAKLNVASIGLKNKILLEYLIQDFDLKASDYPNAKLKKSQKKDLYHVAVMFPFNLPTEKENVTDYLTSKNFGRNKKYYEMYKGIKLAVDSLKKVGVNIKLLAYDTKRDTAQVKKILALPEFKLVDLIIGPILEHTTEVVAAYAENMEINMVNPLNDIGCEYQGFEHAYFALPSGKALASSIHDYAKDNFNGPNVTIVHGSDPADSIAAKHYYNLLRKDSLKNDTIRVVGVNLTNVKKVKESLENSNMDSISHIVVFARRRRESQFIATYMMDPLEASIYKPSVVVPADWLEVDQFSYSQMHQNNIYFVYNGCMKEGSNALSEYKEGYRDRWNMVYTQEYELTGFEIMKFFGMEMKEHGNLFNEGISVAKYECPYAYYGFDFKNSTNNAYVPLMRMDAQYYFRCVNKKATLNEY